MTVAEALASLKTALGPNSERQRIVDAVLAALPSGLYTWLDVGIGDARSTSQLLTALRARGRRFAVLGLDPELSPEAVCEGAETAELIRARLEEHPIDTSFDVINVRQSAYYFDDVVNSLAALLDSLSGGGCLLLTHWSRDCFLYSLHMALAREVQSDATAMSIEEIQTALALARPGSVLESLQVNDTIDMQKVRAVPELATAVLKIAGRRIAIDPQGARARQVLNALTEDSNDAVVRSNGVLVLRRAPAP